MKHIQNVVLMAKCFTPFLVQNMTHCASWMANGIWETRNVFGVVVLNYYSAAAMMPGTQTQQITLFYEETFGVAAIAGLILWCKSFSTCLLCHIYRESDIKKKYACIFLGNILNGFSKILAPRNSTRNPSDYGWIALCRRFKWVWTSRKVC